MWVLRPFYLPTGDSLERIKPSECVLSNYPTCPISLFFSVCKRTTSAAPPSSPSSARMEHSLTTQQENIIQPTSAITRENHYSEVLLPSTSTHFPISPN